MMTDDHIDINNDLYLMSELENFLFLQIQTSFTSPVRFEPSIYKASSRENLKQAIYTLHEQGRFKETDESRQQRFSSRYTDGWFPDEMGNYPKVEKRFTQYLPKHHDEIITNLRKFYKLVDQKQYELAKEQCKTTISAYAKHYDCSDLNLVPESLKEKVQPIQARNFRTLKFLRDYKMICYMHIEEMLTTNNPKKFSKKDDLYKEIDCAEFGLNQKIINSIRKELNRLQFQIIVKHNGKEVSRLLRDQFVQISGSYRVNNDELFVIDTNGIIKVTDGVTFELTGLQYHIEIQHMLLKRDRGRKKGWKNYDQNKSSIYGMIPFLREDPIKYQQSPQNQFEPYDYSWDKYFKDQNTIYGMTPPKEDLIEHEQILQNQFEPYDHIWGKYDKDQNIIYGMIPPKEDLIKHQQILQDYFDSYDDRMTACAEAIDHLTEELIAYEEGEKLPQSRKWLNELPDLKKKLEQMYISK